MLENKPTAAAAAAAFDNNAKGGVVSEKDKATDHANATSHEPKVWYQTVGNNIGQWLAIGSAVIAGVTMYGDFQTKSAVREARMDAQLMQMAQRDDRIEEAARQVEIRRVSEKQEFVNQINGIVGEIRTDLRLIRERLDRGR
jgi:hypothetical protein